MFCGALGAQKMHTDRAHLFRHLFLKKLHCRVHFYQNIENIFCIETSKMNILSYVLWCSWCAKDAHGSCASFGYWFMQHSFDIWGVNLRITANCFFSIFQKTLILWIYDWIYSVALNFKIFVHETGNMLV